MNSIMCFVQSVTCAKMIGHKCRCSYARGDGEVGKISHMEGSWVKRGSKQAPRMRMFLDSLSSFWRRAKVGLARVRLFSSRNKDDETLMRTETFHW